MYLYFIINYGNLKRKKIFFLESAGLRPTKSNVREFFLSLIYHRFYKVYFLDLFAGSGFIGFNLFSLSVYKVVLIEFNYGFYKVLLYNKLLYLDKELNFDVIFFDSYYWLKRFNFLNISFIFIDPPYKFNNIFSYLFHLNKIFFLKGYLFIFIESNNINILNLVPYNWFLLKKGQFGKTFIYFLKKI